ncbi:Thioredoxin domain-containing protein (Membrane protein 23) (mp23) [Durusdinium trenchii]|uniref:Thioredoxin domain-containing protein (Membrane protein 23) (Mp23) n=1 Tax=Durusdinium trenchii TaxID=1381693 RepID=A0ABP0I6I1_9DINO
MEELVRSSPLPVFIVFFLRGCGHCRSMEQEWGALATELKDQVQVASLDALQWRPLTELWGVERFPSIKLVKGDRVYDFHGDREVDDFKAFALGGFASGSGAPLPALPGGAPPHASPGAQPHAPPGARERGDVAERQGASYLHLAIGFGLGMLFAAAIWGCVSWSGTTGTGEATAEKDEKVD